MASTTLHIKNMVCNRCIRVVKEELTGLGLKVMAIELGKVTLSSTPAPEMMEQVRQTMQENGFEIIDDRKSRLVEQIRNTLISLVHYQEEQDRHINMSDYVSKELGYDYPYLSKLFSSVEGVTIERYYILQKTERVKELLVYDELSLKEIAFRLGYSSTQHLSSQFKKITGLSPSHFRTIRENRRKPLDQV